MAIPSNMIAGGAVVMVGVILLAIGTPEGWAGQSAPAVEVAQATPTPTTVAAGGVTLHSVSVELPDSGHTFPGAGADLINDNCLACHSAGMVLTQPGLPRAAWQAEVDKMRDTYKAPVAAEDVPKIVDYLANLKGGK